MDRAPVDVRLARPDDAAFLPAIERSAGELFRSDPELSWIADDAVQSFETHLAFIASSTAWVAVDDDDSPVAFLNGGELGDCFHIWEMSVHRAYQRQGWGSKLMEVARRYAVEKCYPALTLTTFRNIAWNDALYSRLGFRLVQTDQLSEALSQILMDEAKNGLPLERRCAMIMPLVETRA